MTSLLVGRLSPRMRDVLAGAITVTLLVSGTFLGITAATGRFTPRYRLLASFDAAGQGLIRDSDVKIHGVNIGQVASVKLVAGRALVTMDIDSEERVPRVATATIRPKTLFGEKFVDIDPGDDETTGPFLRDGERIEKTTGGFELEKILADLYPVLQSVDGDQLATIVTELSASGRDLGATVNRAIANFSKVADVQARHATETQQFLSDLALLSEELDRRAGDLVAGATDLNAALPPLNARSDELATILDQAARLSTDLADILEANRPFIDKNILYGGKTLQLLYDRRDQLPGLVRGLRYFLQVLGEVGRIELGDGTRLAAVKGILGGGSECGRTTVGCPTYEGDPAGRAASERAAAAGSAQGGDGEQDGGHGDAPVAPPPLPAPTTGPEALVTLVQGLLP
ncbi:MAG TPA: MlaD family protein [Acidimicrobiales bacterium]